MHYKTAKILHADVRQNDTRDDAPSGTCRAGIAGVRVADVPDRQFSVDHPGAKDLFNDLYCTVVQKTRTLADRTFEPHRRRVETLADQLMHDTSKLRDLMRADNTHLSDSWAERQMWQLQQQIVAQRLAELDVEVAHLRTFTSWMTEFRDIIHRGVTS